VQELYGAEGVGPSLYVEDPEGNRVELKGPARPPGRQASGAGLGATGGRAP
jgi:hypothetical protein